MNIQELIKESQKGRLVAQKQLYDAFAGQMLGVCYRYTKSMEDAEDVLQEGFLKMFRNLQNYRNEGEFAGWLRRIMVTTAINFMKRNSKYSTELSFNDMSLAPVINTTNGETPESSLNAKQLASLIRQLPAGYQAVFNLHAVEGYAHAEIGKIMGITDVTSRTQYYKARNVLMNWLKEIENPNIKASKNAG